MTGPGGGPLGRSWRRFRRRAVGVRIAAVGVPIVVVIGIVFAAAGTGHPAKPAPEAPTASPVTAPDRASTSSAGVTAHAINVVFPISNLTALSASLGFAGDVEYSEQTKAIDLFVKTINDAGGIDGRTINPMIVDFDPTNEVGMRALCKQWTEGGASVFAVLDGPGTWNGDNQLCITQEGHTPLISQWTTVTNWTQKGSPYLWWTGPDDAAILQATVTWGLSSGRLGRHIKVGVIAGDRASDQLALNQYLLPDLKRVGITPVVETIAANPSDSATTNSQAPLIVQQLRADGVTSVIPLMPFNVFFPVLQAQTQQQYFPALLLSDYEDSIESALGLIPVPYEKALNGQEGVTTETLGGIDDSRPESEGGYDPGVRSCWVIWHKAYPEIPPGNMNDFIEEQGPVQGWCQAIDLFTAAARAAGPHLDRRTFVEAMAKITNFPGGYAPTLTYGPDRFSGPSRFRVVKVHTNEPPSSQCHTPAKPLPPELVCWVVMKNWQPLPTVG
ncbi:MAG TPA: ABC transporter substrate-binding protein [Acidimicrobiales bacterium]|nr:ABC transporter substrate-binding protein [Acidimicrobiales bacterium]